VIFYKWIIQKILSNWHISD